MLFTVTAYSEEKDDAFRSRDINENISIEQVWDRFLTVCQLAVFDTAEYLATLPETGLLGEKVRAEHSDGNLTSVDLMNGRIWESVVIARIGASLDVDCHFYFDLSKETSFEDIARRFLQIIKSEPDWEYAGGRGQREFPSLAGGQSVSKVDNYQYSILNVWDRRDVSVEVTISKHHAYLGVSAINRD